MESEYCLEIIEGLKSSQLRKEFELIPGRFKNREFKIERVTPDIKNLSERPGYCPLISVIQIKEIEAELFWVYYEYIYTSNAVLDAFEKFSRENMVSVQAKDFEDVPEECSRLFVTPFTKIPVDIPRGVDFSSSCTLEMITAEVLFNKLGEIEKAGNFTAVIERVRGGTITELVKALECRHGNENVTVNHLIFRRKAVN